MRSRGFLAWMKHYGFALLVFLAIVAGTVLAMRTEVPEPVPDFALQAQAVYRIEIGLASFLCLYVPSLLFVSALHGRGMTRFGREGFDLRPVIDQRAQPGIRAQLRRVLRRRRR